MPELPDITLYMEALEARTSGAVLQRVSLRNPFLLRTYDPPLDSLAGHSVVGYRRLGKRIAIGFDHEIWLVMHLMIAGRLQWKSPGEVSTVRNEQGRLEFDTGTLLITEAGTKKQASLRVVREDVLHEEDPGGIDVLQSSLEEFTQSLTLTNRTLKRQLTHPMLFSGIGNAYSDEILHRARLSPIQHTQRLSTEEVHRLWEASRQVLQEWIELLRRKAKGKFPAKVTAFHPEMAVHGKYREPCPVCGNPVQRIVSAENETNYCAGCQTGGQVLADRSLSRLLKDDWPRRIEDWEEK